MQTIVDCCLRVAAFSVAAALIASQIIQNLEHLGWASLYSGLGLAAIAVPIAVALAVPVMDCFRRERAYVFVVAALIVVLGGIAHTSIVAWERVAHARDRAASAATAGNVGIELAKTAHASALARVRDLEAAEKSPCRKAGQDGKPTLECVAARQQTSLARQRAGEAQSALAGLGSAVTTNGMAMRYGTVASVVDIVHPLLLPITVELGGLVLIGFAFRRGKVETQRPPVALAVERPVEKAEAVAAPVRATLPDEIRPELPAPVATKPAPARTGVIASFRPAKRAA